MLQNSVAPPPFWLALLDTGPAEVSVDLASPKARWSELAHG